MKLYYSPGACSLADRIALLEAGRPAVQAAVDAEGLPYSTRLEARAGSA